jgi:tellurite resistance protein
MTLFPDTPLDLHHIQAMVRAMHELALTDGMHDAERVMLRGFYDSCQQETQALTSFDQLIAGPFDVASARDIFDTPERRAALLQSCVFLAYADGNYSAGERAKVKAIADAVGADALELATCEGLVSDHLLQQISRIGNVDALKQVASELDAR